MTTLTAAATHDALSDADYRDIYDELRAGHALRGFIEVAGSTLSASWWSQWEKGEDANWNDIVCQAGDSVSLDYS